MLKIHCVFLAVPTYHVTAVPLSTLLHKYEGRNFLLNQAVYLSTGICNIVTLEVRSAELMTLWMNVFQTARNCILNPEVIRTGGCKAGVHKFYKNRMSHLKIVVARILTWSSVLRTRSIWRHRAKIQSPL